VSYRNAVEDTDAELWKMFQFVGEPHDSASADFIRNRNPINSSFAGEPGPSVPRWLGWTPEERSTFDEVAGDLLVHLGFETEARWVAGV
jgi:hypothetical protein